MRLNGNFHIFLIKSIAYGISTLALATPYISNSNTFGVTAQDLQRNKSEFYLRSASAVVTIQADRVGGRGAVISSDGLILTSRSIVNDSQTIDVKFKNGKQVLADLIKSDRSLAVFKARGQRNLPFLALANSDSVKLGEKAYLIDSYSEKSINELITVTISFLNKEQETIQFIIDPKFNIENGKNASNPLLDRNGKLIGIYFAYFNPESPDKPTLYFAIGLSKIASFLKSQN